MNVRDSSCLICCKLQCAKKYFVGRRMCFDSRRRQFSFHSFQRGPGVHQLSYQKDTGGSYLEGVATAELSSALHLHLVLYFFFFSYSSTAPFRVPRPPHYRGFTITHFRHTTLGRTPLDEGPARRRDLYLTTHNTHKRQTYMFLAGFERGIPASERP
jgi:hypothetical protein